MALSTGTILAGRYEITAPIATGGMGEVWRARDRVLDRIVAAKVLRSEFTGDPSFVARFRNEARHTAALSHPNIASVYDYGETVEDERFPGQQLAFLVMELVEGQPLVTILHEEGKLPVDWTLHVLGQAADGLSAAHRAGVVHRDIKPGNLIVRPDGVVKLTDFGIARARDATPLTRTGMVVGTAQYLSPEQAQGFEVTAASDVYSLGVVGYECLTGGRPFDGTSQVAVALAHINRPPPPLPASIPPAVRLLIERALAKDPDDRFADGGAFAAAVRSVAAGTGLSALPSAPGPRTTPPVVAGPVPPAPATDRTEVVSDLSGDRTEVLGVTSGAGAAGAGTGAMPPLRRPPEDEAEPGDGRHRVDDDGRRNRWMWLVAGLVVLALLGGGAWLLLAGGAEPQADDPARSSAPAPSASASAGTVTVDTASYIGRDAGEITELLSGSGLQVTTRDATAAEVGQWGIPIEAGAVVGSDPADRPVPEGSLVTLFVAPEDYAPASGDDDGEDSGEDSGDAGGADVEAPAPAPAPTPEPTQTTASSPRTTTPSSAGPGSAGTGNRAGQGGEEDSGEAPEEPVVPPRDAQRTGPLGGTPATTTAPQPGTPTPGGGAGAGVDPNAEGQQGPEDPNG